jgi:hypothetical protein
VCTIRTPALQRLKAARLLADRDIVAAVLDWRRTGGSFNQSLMAKTGLKPATLRFFVDWGNAALQQGCRRIGEFLKVAGLVTEAEIQHALAQLQRQNRSLPLGLALTELGIVPEGTADYFAAQFIDGNREGKHINLELMDCLADQQRWADELEKAGCELQRHLVSDFCAYANESLLGSGRGNANAREYARQMLEAYPGHAQVRYWAARLGVKTSS